jgi:hypothetical protein
VAKIIEVMKNLKVIEKRMVANREKISKYAAIVSTERPVFDTESEQKKEVASLIQANMDLIVEYTKGKLLVDKTNAATIVEINGKSYSISELLLLKRKLAQEMIMTFGSLNDNQATMRLRNAQTVDGKVPQVIRMYDERAKNEGTSFWQELYHTIDSRLEVINAMTDVVE